MVRTLARSPRDSVSLVDLLSDADERDRILDHDALYGALIDDCGCLHVSPAFYFYILTRRVLRLAGIEERALSDYVAAVLVAFSHTQQLQPPGAGESSGVARSFGYVSDLLETLAKAAPEQVFVLRSHMGDYSLFYSGIFAERVEAHAARRGAPGLSFYESVGKTAYRTAAQHRQAKQAELSRTYEQLAGEFHAIRVALNRLAENLLHVDTPRVPLIGG